VPSQEPESVTCKAISSQLLSISWEPPPLVSINGILLGYRVIYRPLGGKLYHSLLSSILGLLIAFIFFLSRS
jgi:down syndrome cell adhesion molecule-like protein CG42256